MHDLCTESQLEVLLVEDVATGGDRPQVMTQVCTPHQPHVVGTPTQVSESSGGEKGLVAGASGV